MKKFLLLLLSVSALAKEPEKIYHLSYVEKRDNVVRELSARITGNEIFLDKLEGVFPKDLKSKPPWYLTGFPSFEETTQLELEGLPPLALKRSFEKLSELSLVNYHLTKYRVRLVLQTKEEVIPLNDDEAKQNDVLRPLGIQEIALQGEGELWSNEDKTMIVAEQFFLSGLVVRGEKKEKWQMEWAKALEK